MQSQTFNIVLPIPLVRRVDQAAKRQYKNRSEFIREVLIRNLEDIEKWQKIFRWGKAAGKRAGIKSEADVDRLVYEFRHGKTNGRS